MSALARPDNIAHGTHSGYTYHRCRCSVCGAARAVYQREYRKRHPGKAAAYTRVYRDKHPVKVAVYDREYRKKNADKVRARAREYYKKHPEKAAASTRKYRKTEHGKQVIGVIVRKYRKNNQEKAATYYRNYLKTENGKQVRLLGAHRRRARKMNATGFCTKEQLNARVAFYGWRCWMCRAPYEAIDHVIPLATTGSNWPANLRPACNSCNSSKGTTSVTYAIKVL